MAKNLVMLDYTFLFDPTGTYSNLFQFEQDLAKFFKDGGFEMQTIKTLEGGLGRRIAYITPVTNQLIPEPKNPVGRPQSNGSKLRDLAHRELRAPAKAFINKGK
jgi:hypothetical protein